MHKVNLAKGEGSYPWHRHDGTDDFFLVLQGTLVIEMRDTSITLAAARSDPAGFSVA